MNGTSDTVAVIPPPASVPGEPVPRSKSGSAPMRKIFAIVGAAIVLFLLFTAFSVRTAMTGSEQLAGIKDLYFPVLERLDADIVRIDKMEELYIQVVVLGDRDALDTATDNAKAADAALAEVETLYPAGAKDAGKLRQSLASYRDLASTVAKAYLAQKTDLEEPTAKMNAALAVLKADIRAFRKSSYDNFVITLAGAQKAARLGLLLGISLGVMNLCFMGVLVFFIRNNIRMMAVIAEQNATLENRVAERTAQLSQKTNDINAMLQNMSLGVCTVVPGNRLHPEYSAQLRRIFGVGDVAGQDIVSALFGTSTLGVDVKDQMSVALGAIVGEDAMMFEFNGHLLPREVQISGPDSVRTVQMEWSPIVNDTGTIEKVLLIAQDVTHLRELERASSEQKADLEIISRLIAISVGKFNDFVDSARGFLISNRKLLNAHGTPSPDSIAELFRNMHTVKGNARTYSLNLVTDAAHAAEQTYDRLRKDPAAEWNVRELLAELGAVDAAVERYVSVSENKLGRKGRSADLLTTRGVFVANEDIAKIKTLASGLASADAVPSHRPLYELLGQLGFVPLERLVSGCIDSSASLAAELGKPAPTMRLKNCGVGLTTPFAEALKSCLVHIVRNSMDHGIEAPAERQALGKPEAGQLTFECERRADAVTLHIRDDGRGLALHKLLAKGIEMGAFKTGDSPTREQVANIVFQSGLSTAVSVTTVSGRGVGMDAVRSFLAEQQGSAAIELLDEATELTFAPFKFVIRIPLAAVNA